MAQVLQDFQKTYLETAATTTIFSGPGTLHSIVVGTTAAGSIKVIDGTGTDANIATLKSNIVEGTYLFDCQITTALKVIAAANSIFTVMWKKS